MNFLKKIILFTIIFLVTLFFVFKKSLTYFNFGFVFIKDLNPNRSGYTLMMSHSDFNGFPFAVLKTSGSDLSSNNFYINFIGFLLNFLFFCLVFYFLFLILKLIFKIAHKLSLVIERK